nr:MAG TPA: hypothetical protein [Caudoviricetes sp.]
MGDQVKHKGLVENLHKHEVQKTHVVYFLETLYNTITTLNSEHVSWGSTYNDWEF